MSYDNTNRGSLFKNDRKEQDTHPDYKGQINIDGTDYWLSAWIKEDKNGNKYMSFSPKPKDQAQRGQTSSNKPRQDPNFPDDDLPF